LRGNFFFSPTGMFLFSDLKLIATRGIRTIPPNKVRKPLKVNVPMLAPSLCATNESPHTTAASIQ
jgi:hypothetical protein